MNQVRQPPRSPSRGGPDPNAVANRPLPLGPKSRHANYANAEPNTASAVITIRPA